MDTAIFHRQLPKSAGQAIRNTTASARQLVHLSLESDSRIDAEAARFPGSGRGCRAVRRVRR